jgi:CRISPR-associated protein Csd1
MINALLQYAQDRGLISKPGYAKKTVKWILDFDVRGNNFTGLVTSDREFLTTPNLSQPELKTLGARKGEAAHFLVAPLGTFLGWGKDEKSERRELRRRETLIWMLKEASKTDPTFESLSDTLVDGAVSRAMREEAKSAEPAARPTDLATIRLGGRFPVEDNSWHEWWDGFRTTLKKPIKGQRLMVCFGSGELIKPESTHPKLRKLTGVGLSQPHAPIITFDKDAFESYGLSQGANAAMGEETANAYVNAIDRLLESSVIYSWRRPKRSAEKKLTVDFARLGGTRLAYWYVGPTKAREEVEEHNDLISLTLGSADKEKAPPEDLEEERILAESRLRQIIDRVRSGKTAQPLGNVRFCVLALSGSGGRAMVRDFVEGTVLHLAETTEQWFDDLSIDTYWGQAGYPPSLEQVLTAPLAPKRPDQDYLKWVTPAGTWRHALWRAALTGGRFPATAFARALLAHNNTVIKGDLTDKEKGPTAQRSSRLRLALVKAYLIRIRKGEIEMKPALDPEHPSSAYHCGRLLAVYDSLQRAALGDVGAGVVQRFYGGALTNPAGVFGQLSRMAQTHLSKLDGVLAYLYTERIAEIHNGIRKDDDLAASYPSALDMEGQALFALGFWHQTAAINKERSEAAAAKKGRREAKKTNQLTKEENRHE